MRHTRRLILDGLYNARDLGGYATPQGATRFGVFIRSEAPCDLPAKTTEELREYGITATVDLRGEAEQIKRPSDLRSIMPYHPFCLAGEAESFSLSSAICWEEVYIARAETNRPWVKALMEFCATCEDGLLIHCTTGKDRTGVASCYLLSIAGVSREDIAADYAVSQIYLEPVFQGMRDGTLAIGRGDGIFDPTVFITPASAMLRFQDYLIEKYGSVVGYLKTAGISDETLEQIRQKLTDFA
ncbi:MAG: tyrosine-protein phosphatase [Eubacteriales bacterium]